MKIIGQTDPETTQATDAVNFDQVTANALGEDGILPAVMIPFCIYQNRLESNNYTSNVFKSNNNLNGYNWVPPNGSAWQDAQGTPKPASEGGGYYGHYASVENSAHEQAAWWGRRSDQDGLDLSTIQTIDDFVSALTQFGWFTSSPTAYATRMKAVSVLVNFQQDTGISTEGISNTSILLVLAVIGVFIAIKA